MKGKTTYKKVFELDFSKCDEFVLTVNESKLYVRYDNGTLNVTFDTVNVVDFGLVDKDETVKREKVKFFVETEDEIKHTNVECK